MREAASVSLLRILKAINSLLLKILHNIKNNNKFNNNNSKFNNHIL